MKQVASLRYDVIFKKAFSHPNIFTALVKDFLGIQLNIDQVENDKAFIPPIGNVATKFDLFAQDKSNRVIVEVQHAHDSDTYERFMYYQCSAMVETINSSDSYRFPLTVITLVFFTQKKTPSPDSGIIVHDFEPRDFITNKLLDKVYGYKHKLIYVFTNKAAYTKTPNPYREWMQAIHDSLDGQVDETAYENPLIQALFGIIESDKITPEERARMKEEHNRKEAEMRKFKEGKKEGLEEGLEKGLEEGLEKGKKQMKEAACNFKSLGTLTDEQIAKATGLSLEAIKEL